MTDRQQQCFWWIEDFLAENDGRSPTLEQIGIGMGVGKVTVCEFVGHLTREGWLRREKDSSAFVILKPSMRSQSSILTAAADVLDSAGHADHARNLRRLLPNGGGR